MFKVLLFLHIVSAIVGMGPGFVLTYLVKSAKTMTELRYAYVIKKRLHQFVMVGGTLLFLTGLLMGTQHTYLFQMGWYWLSLALFLTALVMVPFALKPKSSSIKFLLETVHGEKIPVEYNRLAKILYRNEQLINILFLIVISLMILKPF